MQLVERNCVKKLFWIASEFLEANMMLRNGTSYFSYSKMNPLKNKVA